jgi:hypothetical protein
MAKVLMREPEISQGGHMADGQQPQEASSSSQGRRSWACPWPQWSELRTEPSFATPV